MTGFSISVKRLYDPVGEDDGCRILVDRIWPRGISRESLKADIWIKDVAPSTELRKSFNHDESRWEAFKESYFRELDKKSEVVNQLSELSALGNITLLFSARNRQFNQAVALKEYLQIHNSGKQENGNQ